MNIIISAITGAQGSGTPSDPDASLFITNAGITDPTQQSAITAMVISFKNAGLWTTAKAIYPYVGGTATTNKYNLKDPRDLDAAYRIVFAGGVTHNSGGVTFNGTSGIGDTKLVPSTVFGSSYLSLHSYVISSTNTGLYISSDVNFDWSAASPARLDNGNPASSIIVAAQKTGMISIIRKDATNTQKVWNGAISDDVSNPFVANGTSAIAIGSFPGGGLYAAANIGFSAVYDNLTVVQSQDLRDIVLTFLVQIGRIPSTTVFIGDSITESVTSVATRWTKLLSDDKGWTEDNRGVSGSPVESATPLVATNLTDNLAARIPIKKGWMRKLFLGYGGVNDAGYNTASYNTTTFDTQYNAGIDYAISRGWQVSQMVLVCGYYQNGWVDPWGGVNVDSACDDTRYQTFVQKVRDIGTARGILVIDVTGVYGAADTADNIHPNVSGNNKIYLYMDPLIAA